MKKFWVSFGIALCILLAGFAGTTLTGCSLFGCDWEEEDRHTTCILGECVTCIYYEHSCNNDTKTECN